jgi:hypothetical protein
MVEPGPFFKKSFFYPRCFKAVISLNFNDFRWRKVVKMDLKKIGLAPGEPQRFSEKTQYTRKKVQTGDYFQAKHVFFPC